MHDSLDQDNSLYMTLWESCTVRYVGYSRTMLLRSSLQVNIFDIVGKTGSIFFCKKITVIVFYFYFTNSYDNEMAILKNTPDLQAFPLQPFSTPNSKFVIVHPRSHLPLSLSLPPFPCQRRIEIYSLYLLVLILRKAVHRSVDVNRT